MTRARSADASTLIRKLWHYCNVLRDDGLSYPDYVEQLTYLLFLKMADEQSTAQVPSQYGWQSLVGLSAREMHRQYGEALSALGRYGGMLGLIFRNAKNKIRDPGKLRLLIVDLIGQTEWTGLPTDLKGDAYEGLLEKNARDTKSGAGQYFTPRPLIEAIVECVAPHLGEIVCDPACGTAGFLLSAHEYLMNRNPDMTRAQRNHLTRRAIRGVELVEEVARLATMNLLLHGVAGQTDDELPVECADSLKAVPVFRADVVLANPPFGIKGSVTYAAQGRRPQRADDELTIVRPDFWVETANKQLNFLQHISALMKPEGRAAVVVPDNVLFEAGAAAIIRRRLVETCDVHTLLRLPPGLFYAQGVKANVLFFDRLAVPTQRRRDLWVYDVRSEKRFTRTRPLHRDDLQEFVALYRPDARSKRTLKSALEERWRKFSIKDIAATRDCSFDLTWSGVRAPLEGGVSRLDEISRLLTEDLHRALASIAKAAPPKRVDS
jgi:type I restriction enzyme M protein